MTKDVLQVIIAVLGIVSQFLVIARAFRESSKESAPSQVRPLMQSEAPAGKPVRTRSILDLSFVFIGAAFFSFLIMDSLVISGRPPSAGITTIANVLLITVVVGGAMFGAWLFNQVELVTGYMAITTLLVVVLSPGGPFLSADQAGEAGLWLMIPVISLVVISSTMLLYSYGSPLSSSISKRKRLLVSSVLAVITIIGAASLGRQFVKDVAADPKAPHVEDHRVKDLLRNIMQTELNDRRNFYRLASEVNLGGVYRRDAREQKEQEAKYQQAEQGTDAVPATPQPPASGAGGVKNPPAATPGAGAAKPPAPQTSVRPPGSADSSSSTSRKSEAVRQVMEMMEEDQEYWPRQVVRDWMRKSTALYTGVIKEQGRRRGSVRTNSLISYFAALDMSEKEDYLAQRLEWIHPVGLPNQSEARIPLPGLYALQRATNTCDYRIYQVLADKENLRTNLFSEFDGYSGDIRKEFEENTRTNRLLLDPGRNYSRYKRDLFPKPGTNANQANLIEQLGLPLQVEGYVAYDQYKQSALLLIQRDFQNIPEEKRQSIINRFNLLDDATQEAFLVYVVNNKDYPFDQVYRMLVDFYQSKIDFSALINSQNPLAVKKLANMIERQGVNDSDALLVKLAEDIRRCNSKASRDLLLDLLKNELAGIPIKRLFQSQVFDLVDEVTRNVGQEQKALFDALVDPVWQVVKDVATISAGRNASTFNIVESLETFRSLKGPDQEGLLHHLAIALYQPGGPNSLDPISLLIVQARFYDESAALLCAFAIMLPLILAGILVGGFFSRKLVARDRVRDLVSKESAGYSEVEGLFPNPVDLYGRDDVLRSLRSLAERGWSTIGVVGRRGVGKSRLLYALAHTDTDSPEAPIIKVWVSSPSKFQEEDFIYSMFERLALSTEAAIARFLGVKPISTRRIESNTTLVGGCFYASAFVILAIIVYSRASQLTRADIVITWLPILALIFTSIGVFINHLSKLQPVDLSSWLQRDRSHTPHIVMLYREVFDVLKFLRHRVRSNPADETSGRGHLGRALVLTALGVAGACAIVLFFAAMDRPNTAIYALIAVVVFIATVVAWILVHQSRSQRDRASAYGQSLMSLIADYRSFAAMVVYRLKQGALGHSENRKFSVLICVDELDKIVEFEDIRAFVRRIKAIFEVPGLYYYVSLAEDTLTKLYLGPAEGKNEIDSAFDHIVRIAPVSCDMAEAIAAHYLNAHGFSDGPPRLARTIATLSFGVPRDIIRRCDEFIARSDPRSIAPSQLAFDLRKRQGLMGYDLQQLTSSQTAELAREPYVSAVYAQQLLNNGLPDETTQRLVLFLWLVAQVEVAVELPEPEEWKRVSEELCALGYKLPIDQVCDLMEQITGIHHNDLARQAT